MLVLTRKPGESIHLGDNIVVTVVSVENGQVKIGIDAPEGIRIFRTEIYEQIQKQNTSAARAQRDAMVHAAKLIGNIKKKRE